MIKPLDMNTIASWKYDMVTQNAKILIENGLNILCVFQGEVEDKDDFQFYVSLTDYSRDEISNEYYRAEVPFDFFTENNINVEELMLGASFIWFIAEDKNQNPVNKIVLCREVWTQAQIDEINAKALTLYNKIHGIK